MGKMKEWGRGEGGGWSRSPECKWVVLPWQQQETAEVSQGALWEVYSLTVYFEIHPGRAVWRVLMASCGTFIYFPKTQ